MLQGTRIAKLLSLLTVIIPVIPVMGEVSGQKCSTVKCFLQRSREYLASKQTDDALSLLKEGVAQFPDDRDLRLMLGIGYLENGNYFWAIRNFTDIISINPEDCEARAWLGWVYLKQAALDIATDAIEDTNCHGPDKGRLALVRTMIAAARNDDNATLDAFLAARAADALWPADREALTKIMRMVLPEMLPELSWRLEVVTGYTTNALLGSPTDPSSGDVLDSSSAFFNADLWLRFAPFLHEYIRPDIELQIKGISFFNKDVRGLSWADLTGRVGMFIGRLLPRVLIAFRPEWLLLEQGDVYEEGPVWYFDAHRGEVEIEVASWMVVFAGGGRRTFRDMSRSRWEVDLGVGGRADFGNRAVFLWAITGRKYFANSPAWSLWGGSAIAALQTKLPRDFMLKTGISVAVDWYPDSAGYVPWGASEDARFDVLLKPSVSIWSPSWGGVRLGLQYDISWRDSTLYAYDFLDNRITVRLTYAGDSEVIRPRAANEIPLMDLPWTTGIESNDIDRVQDLLRRDEQVQRSSSCVQ